MSALRRTLREETLKDEGEKRRGREVPVTRFQLPVGGAACGPQAAGGLLRRVCEGTSGRTDGGPDSYALTGNDNELVFDRAVEDFLVRSASQFRSLGVKNRVAGCPQVPYDWVVEVLVSEYPHAVTPASSSASIAA